MISLKRKLILGSNSPRRKEILRDAGFEFEVETKDIEEVYPEDTSMEMIPEYLAKLKANAYGLEGKDRILLTADTVVILENDVLGKPKDKTHAKLMLSMLSGKMHTVITGVCIKTDDGTYSFSDRTDVFFRDIKENEIEYYVDSFPPLDKAGAYGIQDWIGMIGIEKIAGSYYNVMGLPIHKVYRELRRYAY